MAGPLFVMNDRVENSAYVKCSASTFPATPAKACVGEKDEEAAG